MQSVDWIQLKFSPKWMMLLENAKIGSAAHRQGEPCSRCQFFDVMHVFGARGKQAQTALSWLDDRLPILGIHEIESAALEINSVLTQIH
jgi:hypothetical protein